MASRRVCMKCLTWYSGDHCDKCPPPPEAPTFSEREIREQTGLMGRSLVKLIVTMPDGSTLEREQTFKDVEIEGRLQIGDPQPWMENPERAWPNPQDPITFTTGVKPGCEDEARAWFEGLTTTKEPFDG